MSDPIQDFGKQLRKVENRKDIALQCLANAQGIRSTLGGIGIGGSSDVADRYAALDEAAARMLKEWEDADDRRQELQELIDMTPDPDVLTEALRDVVKHGSLNKARVARRCGVDRSTLSRRYSAALQGLRDAIRKHGSV